MEIALVLGLLVAAIILFSTERIGVDLVTGLLLIVLVLTGIISTHEAFAAFGTEFIIMLASIYVITNAVETSGVLDEVATRLSRSRPAKVVGLMLWLLPFTALMSAFTVMTLRNPNRSMMRAASVFMNSAPTAEPKVMRPERNGVSPKPTCNNSGSRKGSAPMPRRNNAVARSLRSICWASIR